MKDLKFDNQRGTSVACDLVDVVRCSDCKHWVGGPSTWVGGCHIWEKGTGKIIPTIRDGFCHLGERKG